MADFSSMPILKKAKRIVYKIIKGFRRQRIVRRLERKLRSSSPEIMPQVLNRALRFAESLRVDEEPYGRYRYSSSGQVSLLYASVYAALLRHLLGDLDKLSLEEKSQWIDYINSHQCEDGLYRDPLVANDIAEIEDWWGWRHLSSHVIIALTCLGGKPRCSFVFLNKLHEPGGAYKWISELPWREKPDFVSNTVINYGVLLQYERDFNSNESAGQALEEIFDFLDETQDPASGLWGNLPPRTPQELSTAVQTSYHLWNLYFYDGRSIHYTERAIDSCLATQNELGGYGVNPNSSACEDIDTIDPLCRFYFLSDYRRAEIENSLRKTLRWVLVNQMADGGFVFKRFSSFRYGHELMETGQEESHLFATWFRTLSIAYICRVLALPDFSAAFWRWVKSPGYQFWHE